MNIFTSEQGAGKLAKDLTANAILMATSKYVKNGPTPVGEYQPIQKLDHSHSSNRYGANRRLKQKQDISSKTNSIISEPLQIKQFVVEHVEQKGSNNGGIQRQSSQNNLNQFMAVGGNNMQVSQTRFMTPKVRNTTGLNRNINNNNNTSTTNINININSNNNNSNSNTNNNNNNNNNANINVNSNNKQQIIQQNANVTTNNRMYVNESKGKLSKEINSTVLMQQILHTPQTSRYGANRRVQPQKGQQIISPINNNNNNNTNINNSNTNNNTNINNTNNTNTNNNNNNINKPTNTPNKNNNTNSNKVQQKIQIEQQKTQTVQQTQPISRSQVASSTRSRVNRTIQVSTPINKINKNQNISSPTVQITNIDNIKTQTKQQPQISQNSSRIARTTGRTQLKSNKVQTPSQNQVQQQQTNVQTVKVIKRSKIIIYVLKNLYNTKIFDTFNVLKYRNTVLKVKQNKFTKLFMFKIRQVCNNVINQCFKAAFTKINKTNAIKSINNNKINNNVDSLQQKCKNVLISVLHKIYLRKSLQVFNKIKPTNKNYIKIGKIVYILDKLANRKLRESLKLLNINLFIKENVKSKYIWRMMVILKGYHLYLYHNSFNKLKQIKKKQQAKQQNKNIKLQSTTPDRNLTNPSPQSSIARSPSAAMAKLQNQLKANTNKLNSLNEQIQKQKTQYQSKIQSLKVSCEQLSVYNEQKRKQSEFLKQKVQSMQMPQQNYIQQNDLLHDTKFPVLYELYIKVQKSRIQDIKIQDLLQTSQFLQQQMGRDSYVKVWQQIYKNNMLKKMIGQYQGNSEEQRKVAKIAHEEQIMLIQLIKGYIKQQYAWEWVRSSLAGGTNIA